MLYLTSLFRNRCLSTKLISTSRFLSMDVNNRNTHLERTAQNFRAQCSSTATVDEICDISPTVRKLSLSVHDKTFQFKAGQWVDFTIPGVDVVGGFSMCSSPQRLQSLGLLELAVKYSTHPPAHWVHTQCKPGSEVELRIGGDFCYDPSSASNPSDLLLIAGGVGINPLMSIIHECVDRAGSGSFSRDHPPTVCLLYSASSSEELLFKSDLEELCTKQKNITVKFFITKEHMSGSVTDKRIDSTVLEETLDTVFTDRSKVLCYICGPGEMIDSLEQKLLHLNIKQQQIIYEKWW